MNFNIIFSLLFILLYFYLYLIKFNIFSIQHTIQCIILLQNEIMN